MYSFISKNINIEDSYNLGKFKLSALKVEFADVDYQVIMANRDYINRTFQPNSGWPDENYTYSENYDAILRHEIEFKSRTTFVYAIFLANDYIGCVYIRPIAPKSFCDLRHKLFDAQIFFWLTKRMDQSYSGELYHLLQQFIRDSFKLEKLAFPGRSISWDNWRLLERGKFII